MIYSDYVARLVVLLGADSSTETNFATYLPQVIQDAENMIYRALDPLAMRKQGTGSIAPAATSITLPADWLVGRELFVTSGAGAVSRVRRCEDSFLNTYTGTGTPRYWAQPTFGSLTFAPASDATYTWSASYTYQPAVLSATNTTTWLSLYVPDLFFSASMLLFSAYEKNFGAASDNPQMAMSWDQIYQRELASAVKVEGRRKGEGYFDATSSPAPATLATRGV